MDVRLGAHGHGCAGAAVTPEPGGSPRYRKLEVAAEMSRSKHARRWWLVAIAMMLPLWPLMAMASTPDAAIVVSTPALPVRSCPAVTCDTLIEAPLGADIAVDGDVEDGFLPVTYAGTSGYALPAFVATDPDDPPVFAAGSPGCQRVAFLFNIGVGFPPDIGIIDTLEREEVPAAMFVMGWWVDEAPPLLDRLVNDGYLIGSHGYGSTELTTLSDDAVLDDITHAATAIEEATGQPQAPYFTPYAAAIDARVRAIVAGQGFLPVAWEVPAADYGANITADQVYRKVMDNMYDGAIVEFHLDGEASAQSTGVALPRIIDDLRAQGYQFVSLPDLMLPC